MRAVVMAAVAAAGLGTTAQAATTFQANLMVDEVVGYFDGSEDFSVVPNVSFSLEGSLPSVDAVEYGDSRDWTYVMPGSMALSFQGSLLEFSGQISGGLDVYIDREFSYGEVRYSTSFSGVAADGTEVDFGVSGYSPGSPFGSDDFDIAGAEALTAGLDSGSFVFSTGTSGDGGVSLDLSGPGGTFTSLVYIPEYLGSPYRLDVTSDSLPSPVPLPASGVLLAFGVVGLAAARRRKH